MTTDLIAAPAGTPDGARASGAGRWAPDRQRQGLALLVISAAQLMMVLDVTIVNVALPSIQRGLHFSTANLVWVITAYSLTFGGLLLFGGRTGDLFGRRRMFMVGLAVFTLASLAGGFATDSAWLVATRACQGIGAAIASPTALSLIVVNFKEGAPRNRAMGVYAAVSSAGGAIGLLAGGVLVDFVSWRWVLFVNVPIGVLVLLAAPRVLQEGRRTRGRLDVPGTLTVTAGMAVLVYGLTNAASHGWTSDRTLGCLAAALMLLATFVLIEMRSAHPLMPLRIFANRDRSGAYLTMLLLGAALFSVIYFLTLFFQDVQHYSPLRTGLYFLPFAAMIGVGAQLSSRLVARLGPRVLVPSGVAVAAVGLGWLTTIQAGMSYPAALGPFLVIGFGMGTAFVPLTLGALSGVAPHDSGLASALLNTGQQIGGAIGVAALSSIAVTTTTSRVHALAAAHHGAVTPSLLAGAETYGFVHAFVVAAAIAAAAFVVAVVAIRVKGAAKTGGRRLPPLPEAGLDAAGLEPAGRWHARSGGSDAGGHARAVGPAPALARGPLPGHGRRDGAVRLRRCRHPDGSPGACRLPVCRRDAAARLRDPDGRRDRAGGRRRRLPGGRRWPAGVRWRGAAVGGEHLPRPRRSHDRAVQAPGRRACRAAGRAGRAPGPAHDPAPAGRHRRRQRPAGAAGHVRRGDAIRRPGRLRRVPRRRPLRPHAGAKPAGKGWNNKRGRAERGRADTHVAARDGRAVCFVTGEPSGLAKTLPLALAELKKAAGPGARIMLWFDRGGACPQVFRHCREQHADWVTCRRAPLAVPAMLPVITTTTTGGRRRQVAWAEETAQVKDYGAARQITLSEAGQVALQILTSDFAACPAEIVSWLKSRWREENFLKYASANYGIDKICDYIAVIETNTKIVDNPARKKAVPAVRQADKTLAAARGDLAAMLGDPAIPAALKNAKLIPAAQKKIARAEKAQAAATAACHQVPAKLPASAIDPEAKAALLRTRRRGLQMVLRLLAHNAEHWLSRRLNAYLRDHPEITQSNRMATRPRLLRVTRRSGGMSRRRRRRGPRRRPSRRRASVLAAADHATTTGWRSRRERRRSHPRPPTCWPAPRRRRQAAAPPVRRDPARRRGPRARGRTPARPSRRAPRRPRGGTAPTARPGRPGR